MFRKVFEGKKYANIGFDDLKKMATGKWLDFNGFRILGKIITHKHLVFYDEVPEGAVLDYHYHDDAKETIQVVKGVFKINDVLKIKQGDIRTFYKGDVHKVEAIEDGNLIVTIEKIY